MISYYAIKLEEDIRLGLFSLPVNHFLVSNLQVRVSYEMKVKDRRLLIMRILQWLRNT